MHVWSPWCHVDEFSDGCAKVLAIVTIQKSCCRELHHYRAPTWICSPFFSIFRGQQRTDRSAPRNRSWTRASVACARMLSNMMRSVTCSVLSIGARRAPKNRREDPTRRGCLVFPVTLHLRHLCGVGSSGIPTGLVKLICSMHKGGGWEILSNISCAVVHFGDISAQCIGTIVENDQTFSSERPLGDAPHAPANQEDVRASGDRLLDPDQQQKRLNLIKNGVDAISHASY